MSESTPDVGVTEKIAADSSPQSLQRAAAVLQAGGTVFMQEIDLALSVHEGVLRCAVQDFEPLAHRCAVEYEVLVENRRRALEATAFTVYLPPLPRRWIVVDAQGAAPDTLWTAP